MLTRLTLSKLPTAFFNMLFVLTTLFWRFCEEVDAFLYEKKPHHEMSGRKENMTDMFNHKPSFLNFHEVKKILHNSAWHTYLRIFVVCFLYFSLILSYQKFSLLVVLLIFYFALWNLSSFNVTF